MKEKAKKSPKKKSWTRRRHKLVRDLVAIFFGPYVKAKYKIKVDKYENESKKPMLILYNHQTAFDQFFVGLAFREPIYYVASEDLFSMGWVSKLIKFLVAPIPIKKQTNDARAVINCIKVSREGGAIAIAPEGNRTYSGKTEYVKPSIAQLARHLGLPIAFFVIEGGYGKHPRWSDVVRGGSMRAGVRRVLTPEEYEGMSDGELLSVIKDELYRDESASDGEYGHARLAEYLERAIYYCPACGLSTFESSGDIIECKKCGRRARYLPTKQLEGVGESFPYRTVSEWYDAQSAYVNSLDTASLSDELLYSESAELSEVIMYDRKRRIASSAQIKLFGGSIAITCGADEYLFPFDKVTAVSVLGKNKVDVYFDGRVYQLKGNEHFCGLKYVNLFYRYKNITKGEKNAEFLGL